MMPLSEMLFLAIVFYLLYRFVFNFLLPVVRATRQVRQQFRNMQGGEQKEAASGAGATRPSSGAGRPAERHSSTKGPAEDYIDFEEIKK
jgi:hypothetical protein